MKKAILRMVTVFLCVVFLLPCVPVFANSLPVRIIPGNNGIGVVAVDADNPIIVEHETLTFDISSFPEQDSSLEDNAKVTAQYTFYNPSEQAVTATLLFPLGTQPEYAHYYTEAQRAEMGDAYEVEVVDDTRQYDVLVDGKPVEKTLRHSYYEPFYDEDFLLEEQLQRLQNGFVEDDFFSPELPVTKYIYQVENLKPKNETALLAHFDFRDIEKDKGTVVFVPDWCSKGDEAVGVRVEENGKQIEVYAIGGPLSQPPKTGVYEGYNWEESDPRFGDVVLVSTETITFKEMALARRLANSPVSESDWYNTVVLEAQRQNNGIILMEGYARNYDNRLMRWYEYEITVEAGSRIVNTVTAPIYPGIDEAYNPPVYRYQYLLSPAQKWESFGSLEIVVNTPYYMLESNQGEFTKTDNGYALTLNGLPDGELEISLCTKKHPGIVMSPFGYALIAFFVIMAVVITSLVIAFLKKPKKKA